MGRRAIPAVVRFAQRVDRSAGPDGCWPYLGTRVGDGYGQIVVDGHARVATHVALEVAGRPAPIRGMQVLHSCDNPPCVNPAHLRWGTNAENLAERNQRGRQARGEGHGLSRLTSADVLSIREMASTGSTHTGIARLFSVSRSTVSDVVARKRWAWL